MVTTSVSNGAAMAKSVTRTASSTRLASAFSPASSQMCTANSAISEIPVARRISAAPPSRPEALEKSESAAAA